MTAHGAPTYLHHRSSTPIPGELVGQLEHLRVSLITEKPKLIKFDGSPSVRVSIHVGPPIEADCGRGGERFIGRTIHGDIGIIPAKMPGTWEIKQRHVALILAPWLEVSPEGGKRMRRRPGGIENQESFL